MSNAAAPIAPPMAAPVAPVATPPLVAVQPPVPPPQAPANTGADGKMADGGDVGGEGNKNPFVAMFDGINVVDVAISAVVVAGMFYAISYYKYMLLLERTGYEDLSQRTLKLESANQAATATSTATANAAGVVGGRKKRPVMRLG